MKKKSLKMIFLFLSLSWLLYTENLKYKHLAEDKSCIKLRIWMVLRLKISVLLVWQAMLVVI